MPRFVKLVIVLIVAIAIGLGVAKLNEQKQRFMALSEEEQRAFLADKIGSKLPPDKLEEIQDAVISAVSKRAG
jgi:hypothetical protein